MAETPERVAAVFADKEANAQKRKEQRASAAMRRRKADQAARGDIDAQDPLVLRMRWWDALNGPALGNGVKAARLAGYADSYCHEASRKNRKHFQPQLAALAEEKLNRSDLIEALHETAQGVGYELAFNGADFDVEATLTNLDAAGKRGQLIGAETKQTKYGKETKLIFRDADAALRTLIDISGIKAAVKIDLTNVPRAELESEGEKYLRELQEMARLEGVIEADYGDDTSEADTRGD